MSTILRLLLANRGDIAIRVSRATVPGQISIVWVSPGDNLARGDILLCIKAVKMATGLCTKRADRVPR